MSQNSGPARDDLPAFFTSADDHAKASQRTTLQYRFALLGLGVLAAVLGALTIRVDETDAAGIGAAIVFSVGAIVQSAAVRARPEQAWYEGRAAAESAKSLTWRYACGGQPFTVGKPANSADSLFITRLSQLTEDLTTLDEPADGRQQITDWMRSLRSKTLAERREAYRKGRLLDQQGWYSSKARLNKRHARHFGRASVSMQVVGALAAAAKAAGLIDVDLLGIVATAAASILAWTQLRQHESLARAYAIASHELALVESLVDQHATEESWARFVDEAEEAISREHTLWRASALRTS